MKVQGRKGIALVECINRHIGKYRIRWDVQPIESEDGEDMVSYYETDLIVYHKPNINDIRKAIYEAINRMTNVKILSGFIWKDMPVWLSSENQFNYKAAYDLAVQTNGSNLPIVFKFGDTETPIYYEFKSLIELSDFYVKAVNYINEQLAMGWAQKDSIDWEDYK